MSSRQQRIDKITFPFNAKFARDCQHVTSLSETMGISMAEAAAYIGFLMAYAFVYGNAEDDGTIEHLNPFEIENYCLWQGERGQLINSFIAAGVLTEYPLRIAYDGLWEPYFVNGLSVKRAADSERQRKRRSKQEALAAAAIAAGLSVDTNS